MKSHQMPKYRPPGNRIHPSGLRAPVQIPMRAPLVCYQVGEQCLFRTRVDLSTLKYWLPVQTRSLLLSDALFRVQLGACLKARCIITLARYEIAKGLQSEMEWWISKDYVAQHLVEGVQDFVFDLNFYKRLIQRVTISIMYQSLVTSFLAHSQKYHPVIATPSS